MKKELNAIQVQRVVLFAGVLLMAIKFLAHFLTGSNAILSDALESIINVAAGFFALISLRIASKPKDDNHPYGHGKIEFISAGFEGGMIVLAAVYILFEAVLSFIEPPEIKQLDTGIYLVAFSGMVNMALGLWQIKTGKRVKSEALVADGRHLLADTYTSIGLVVGLILVAVTNYQWLDGCIAMLMGFMILFTGYRLIRRSLAGLMDETDPEIMKELLPVLQQNRRDTWIDMHNLRVVKYGSEYHIDAHVTLPWYWSLEEAHEEVTAIDELVSKDFHRNIELFIHADPCIPESCTVCKIGQCPHRRREFIEQPVWTENNLLSNKKHSA